MQHSTRKLQVFAVLFLASTILATCFLFCNSFAHASSSTTTYLLVSPLAYVSNALGETFEIDVKICSAEDLHAFELKLSYNTTLLDVAEVVQGPFFSPPPESSIDNLEIDEMEGSVWLGISLSDSTQVKSGDGTLVSITFNVTFAPASPTKACCVLDLQETTLYDSTMTATVHSHIDGLYFWRSMLDDPDGGLLLDLTSQKGGVGIGEPSPYFSLGELVELSARLTYNEDPVQNKLVGFFVRRMKVLARSASTDNNGVATIEFRIPISFECVGTWEVIAISEVVEKTIWDLLYFRVIGPVGGHAAPIEKMPPPTSHVDLCCLFLLAIIILTMAVKKHACILTHARFGLSFTMDAPVKSLGIRYFLAIQLDFFCIAK